MLAVLLPTEDLENDCLTSLVGQILSDLIIGGILAKKVAEPWLIWEGITILCRKILQERNTDTAELDAFFMSLRSGVVALDKDSGPTKCSTKSRGWSVQAFFWRLIHWAFFGYTVIRVFISAAISSRLLPSRLGGNLGVLGSPKAIEPSRGPSSTRHQAEMAVQQDDHHGIQVERDGLVEKSQAPVKKPVLAFNIGPCMCNLLELHSRMPWLRGMASWMQWMAIRGPGRIAGLDGPMDR